MKNYIIYFLIFLSCYNLELHATKKHRRKNNKKIYSHKMHRGKKHFPQQAQTQFVPNSSFLGNSLDYLENHIIKELQEDLQPTEYPYGWANNELEKIQHYVSNVVDNALDRVIGEVTPAKVFIAMNGIWCACIADVWLPFIGYQAPNGVDL